MALPDTEVAGWRAWYDDGHVYSSSLYLWADLPDDGVLARVIYFSDGTKQFQCGSDYYFEAKHEAGTIYGMGGDRDDIAKRYVNPVIKRGRWAPDNLFRRVQLAAAESVL